jgi:plasmid stabilization system protein ParE
MSYHYKVLPAAQKEYEAALKWYRKKSLQAAENFVAAVEKTFERICQRPTWWRNAYKHYRELGVKKYPYTVIYVVEENELVLVTSLYHHKRNPGKKYRKV